MLTNAKFSKPILLYITIAFLKIIHANEKHSECLETPCDKYSKAEIIQNLWSNTNDLTLLGEEVKDVILHNVDYASESELNVLFAQTMWVTDFYSSYEGETMSGSCMSENILKLSLDPTLSNAEYNRAVDDYNNFIAGLTNFTYAMSLRAAGCPSELPTKVTHPTQCRSECTLKDFLSKFDDDIPDNMRKIIKKLSKSQCIVDYTVGMTLASILVSPLNEFYQELLSHAEFSKVFQLKACNIEIPKSSCDSRKDEIIRRRVAALPIFLDLVNGLKKNECQSKI